MSTRAQLAGAVSLTLLAGAGAACSLPSTMTCRQVTTGVTLNGNLSEWADVAGITTPIRGIRGSTYEPGSAVFKCAYNTTHIHFALQVPGPYTFDANTSEKCASVALMFKVGAQATFLNMGGCAAGMDESACDSLQASGACAGHTVDIGAHWELPGTQRGQAYSVNSAAGASSDEYAFSPYCRGVDSGPGAGNEWVGAWDHSNAAEGAAGSYTFELTRSLATASAATDAQLAVNRTYSFGIAFWDPSQTADGWSDDGHYVTGCGTDWINLVVGNDGMLNTDDNGAPDVRGSSARAGLLLAMVGTAMRSQRGPY